MVSEDPYNVDVEFNAFFFKSPITFHDKEFLLAAYLLECIMVMWKEVVFSKSLLKQRLGCYL